LGGTLVAFLLVLYLLSSWIFTSLGSALIESQPPRNADAALVLAGDSFGNRILKGGELAQQGFVPVVYVSGPSGAYGRTEDELAIRFATERGQQAQWFSGLPNHATSTLDEANMLLPQLRAKGVNRLLLVTSNFHTARAARIFRRTDPKMQITVVAANDPNFPPYAWWTTRQGQKTFFFEVSKTIADFVGL